MPFKTKKRRFGARKARKTVRKTRSLKLYKKPQQFRRGVTLTGTPWITKAVSGLGSLNYSEDSWVIACSAISNVTYVSVAQQYSVDMVPSGHRGFLALFDQYKIRRVVNKITPYSTNSALQSARSASYGNQNLGILFHSVIDHDDAAAIQANADGIDDMRQRPSYRVRNFMNSSGTPITQSFTPHLAVGAYGGGVFGRYANMKNQWIDSNSPDVQHYGYKYIIEIFNPTPSSPVYIWFKNECFITLDTKDPI